MRLKLDTAGNYKICALCLLYGGGSPRAVKPLFVCSGCRAQCCEHSCTIDDNKGPVCGRCQINCRRSLR